MQDTSPAYAALMLITPIKIIPIYCGAKQSGMLDGLRTKSGFMKLQRVTTSGYCACDQPLHEAVSPARGWGSHVCCDAILTTDPRDNQHASQAVGYRLGNKGRHQGQKLRLLHRSRWQLSCRYKRELPRYIRRQAQHTSSEGSMEPEAVVRSTKDRH